VESGGRGGQGSPRAVAPTGRQSPSYWSNQRMNTKWRVHMRYEIYRQASMFLLCLLLQFPQVQPAFLPSLHFRARISVSRAFGSLWNSRILWTFLENRCPHYTTASALASPADWSTYHHIVAYRPDAKWWLCKQRPLLGNARNNRTNQCFLWSVQQPLLCNGAVNVPLQQ
jgi:hypothetical protein